MGCVKFLAQDSFFRQDRFVDIALRWSAREGTLFFYRHIAPLEQRDLFRNKALFTPEA